MIHWKARITGVAIAALTVGTANAALMTSDFADPSFENDGTTVMTTDRYQAGGGVNNWSSLSSIDPGKWTLRTVPAATSGGGIRNGILEDKGNYRTGQTTTPAGVSGDQWFIASRADNQGRAIMQYVDTGGTTGDVTISIDYWVRELAGGALSGSAQLNFQVFAFNDPDLVGFQNSSPNFTDINVADPIRGRATVSSSTWVKGLNYVSVGDSFVAFDSTSTATGFQTLTQTLSLGTTEYQYVGVAVGFLGDSLSGSTGEVPAIDNLQVESSVIPEPASLALLGVGGLLIVRRRR